MVPDMDTTAMTARAHEVIAPGSGTHLHFLNHLATVKVAAEGERSMSVVQFDAVMRLSEDDA